MTLQFSLATAAPETAATACILLGVYEQGVLTSAAARVDGAIGGAIKRQVESGDITGKAGSTTLIYAPAGIAAKRVLVVGLGAQKGFDAARYQKVAIEAARALGKLPLTEAVSYLTGVEVPGRDAEWRVRTAALAADHVAYRYTATVKPRDKNAPPELAALAFAADIGAESGLAQARGIAEGVRFARELANLPPNLCTPAYIADQAEAFAEAHAQVSCTVLDHVEMEKQGFGSLLAVARGSANKPKLIALQYRGGAEGAAPYALIGKGITFDTGGISLKPGPGMEEMKFDMGGAAGMLGAFVAAVEMGLKLNLVCVVPAAENMPDGDSYRPGDVLTSLSGQTIEVLNTDAEGRLVLADALWYCNERFQPRFMVNLATLTGAIMVALGQYHAGLFSNNDDLAGNLESAGQATQERLWRMPLGAEYDKLIDSKNADMKNIGGRYGGAIIAAQFLQRFVKDTPWAHLDIAGTAMGAPSSEINQSWGSGYGVRLLDRLVRDHYEG